MTDRILVIAYRDICKALSDMFDVSRVSHPTENIQPIHNFMERIITAVSSRLRFPDRQLPSGMRLERDFRSDLYNAICQVRVQSVR
jgi:hypothetical protein